MTRWRTTTLVLTLVSLVLAIPAWAQTSGTTKPRARKNTGAPVGDEMVKAAQQALREKGLNPGSVDGRMGPKTQQAIRDYQASHGLEPTGRLDLNTLVSLGVEPARTSSADDESASDVSASAY